MLSSCDTWHRHNLCHCITKWIGQSYMSCNIKWNIKDCILIISWNISPIVFMHMFLENMFFSSSSIAYCPPDVYCFVSVLKIFSYNISLLVSPFPIPQRSTPPPYPFNSMHSFCLSLGNNQANKKQAYK